jgi:NADH-quinone oxidoreductase subunit C
MEENISALIAEFGESISEPRVFRGETSLEIRDASCLQAVCGFLKQKLGFQFLVDISSLDHWGEDLRFTVVYEVRNMDSGENIRLRVSFTEESAEIPSVSQVWPAANWHEREIFDMMGIRFSGHPDLRRILMWEGYPYFPLRKDFPLSGKPTEMPDVAFTRQAPLEGGPFVTAPTEKSSVHREPRAKTFEA